MPSENLVTTAQSIAKAGLASAVFAFGLTAATTAQDSGQSPSATVNALIQCQTTSDDAARLACLEDKLSTFISAMNSGQLVVIERDTPQMAEAVADAVVNAQVQVVTFEPWNDFGFSRPRIMPADPQGGSDPRPIEVADGVTAQVDSDGRIEAIAGLEVSAVEIRPSRDTLIRLANGQVWRQTDARHIRRLRERDLEAGVTATIEKGLLGSYFMELSHSRWRLRVERVR